MTTGADLLRVAESQFGGRYVYGAKWPLTQPNPRNLGLATDCSGYLRWVAAQAGIRIPDGSWNQEAAFREAGTIVTIGVALSTPGAILGHPGHIALSRGNNTTAEARGASFGVGTWSALGRPWTYGALMPGVNYGGAPAPVGQRVLKLTTPVMSGDDVRELQALLSPFIKGGLIVDGQFGSVTNAAVLSFQMARGLAVDGIVGALTWAALRTPVAPDGTPAWYTRQLKVANPYLVGEDVRVVQRKTGATVDGVYGPNTAGNVRNYQQAHALSVDGVVGPATAKSLGA